MYRSFYAFTRPACAMVIAAGIALAIGTAPAFAQESTSGQAPEETIAASNTQASNPASSQAHSGSAEVAHESEIASTPEAAADAFSAQDTPSSDIPQPEEGSEGTDDPQDNAPQPPAAGNQSAANTENNTAALPEDGLAQGGETLPDNSLKQDNTSITNTPLQNEANSTGQAQDADKGQNASEEKDDTSSAQEASDSVQVNEPTTSEAVKNGWYTSPAGKKFYFVNDSPLTGKHEIDKAYYYFYTSTDQKVQNRQAVTGEMLLGEAFVESENAWNYYAADGKMATGWVHLGDGRWVYYQTDTGAMLYGEQCVPYFNSKNNNYTNSDYHWYYFDDTTGATTYGWKFVGSNNGKWVYYQQGMGWMLYGEQYLPYNNQTNERHWYYFDNNTGAASYGWKYIPAGKKWVFYDQTTAWMLYGEQYLPYNNQTNERHWYYFDEATGATTYGWKYIASGKKWVYYNPTMGWMTYGESYNPKDNNSKKCHWYYFNKNTGAVTYGWKWITSEGKWVYYHTQMGWMLYGEQAIDNKWYYLDQYTGERHIGWHYDKANKKTVYYDYPTGAMVHGSFTWGGKTYYANKTTGAIANPPSSVSGLARVNLATLIRQGRIGSVRLIGDSISFGMSSESIVPASDSVLFNADGTTYFEGSFDVPSFANYLRKYLNSNNVNFVNAGINTKSMADFTKYANKWLGGETDTVILMLGTNDRAESITEYKNNTRAALNYISPRVKNVYVVSCIPDNESAGSGKLSSMAGALKTVTNSYNNCTYVPFYEATLQTLQLSDTSLCNYYDDDVHPTASGHALMWNAFQTLLR